MKTYYSPKELIDLPGMPASKTDNVDSKIRTIQLKASRESWNYIEVNAKGGPGGKRREYALASLPAETRDHLMKQHIDTLAATLPAVREAAPPAVIEPAQLPALTSLTKHQVDVMDARTWFMRMIEKRPAGHSIKKAMAAIIDRVASGEPTFAPMAAAANDRQGKGRTLAQRSLMRWWTSWRDSGGKPEALAPNGSDAKRVAREAVLVSWVREYTPASNLAPPPEVPAWLPYLLDEYRRSSEPSLADSVRKMHLPVAISRPSYDQANRICEKIPEIYLQKGRKTGAEYRSLMGFTRRDASEYNPFTVGQIDGHSIKCYVAHPVTGAHFHPEVCGIICLTTKVMAGVSAGLAESWRTVADAYRHACTIDENKKWGGVFAIIEADRGSGNMAIKNSDKLTGMFSRNGTNLIVPEKGGNPQGHGAIERSNQSIWIRAAKDLITYTGKDMDRVTRKRVYTRLEQDLKKVQKAGKLGLVEKTSDLLMSWREFLAWLEKVVWEYNNTPHSALPKITCPQTGRRRHMTPFECLAEHIARGWQPVPEHPYRWTQKQATWWAKLRLTTAPGRGAPAHS